MLPFGKLRVTAKEGGGSPSRFTPDEQQTVMTLWSIFRSPLIFGGDLPSLDPATLALITNDEVLAVNQRSTHNRQALEEGNIRVWTADAADAPDRYVAVFNLGDDVANVDLPWSKVGIDSFIVQARDLWGKTSLGEKDRLFVTLRPHASALYRISQ